MSLTLAGATLAAAAVSGAAGVASGAMGNFKSWKKTKRAMNLQFKHNQLAADAQLQRQKDWFKWMQNADSPLARRMRLIQGGYNPQLMSEAQVQSPQLSSSPEVTPTTFNDRYSNPVGEALNSALTMAEIKKKESEADLNEERLNTEKTQQTLNDTMSHFNEIQAELTDFIKENVHIKNQIDEIKLSIDRITRGLTINNAFKENQILFYKTGILQNQLWGIAAMNPIAVERARQLVTLTQFQIGESFARTYEYFTRGDLNVASADRETASIGLLKSQQIYQEILNSYFKDQNGDIDDSKVDYYFGADADEKHSRADLNREAKENLKSDREYTERRTKTEPWKAFGSVAGGVAGAVFTLTSLGALFKGNGHRPIGFGSAAGSSKAGSKMLNSYVKNFLKDLPKRVQGNFIKGFNAFAPSAFVLGVGSISVDGKPLSQWAEENKQRAEAIKAHSFDPTYGYNGRR